MIVKLGLFLLGLVNLAGVLFLYFVVGKWLKKQDELQKKLLQLQKSIRGLQVADMRFNRKVDELKHETEEALNQAEHDEGDVSREEKYHYALKLLQMGLNLEEVMKSCELGRAEAELLQTMEGYQRMKRKS